MTIGQIVFDALTWCRYFAANQSIGLQETTLLFYEAFQATYQESMQSFPEYFEVSAAWAGATYTLPANFRQLDVMVVDDAGCTSGYAEKIDPTEWDIRESNTRNQGTATSPHCKVDQTVITLSPATLTSGHIYYFRNYSEADFADQTQDLILFLPLVFHSLLLSKMQELIQVRHFQIETDPSIRDKVAATIRMTAAKSKRSLKPLEIIEGQTEKPTSFIGQE